MQCPKCGSNVNENDAFCQKCGCNLKELPNQVSANNIKVASTGVCPHCLKPFSPKGNGIYKLLNVLFIVDGIFFAICAFSILLILFGNKANPWIPTLVFGAILVAIHIGKKKVQAKMDEEFCPHCGKNKKGAISSVPLVNVNYAQNNAKISFEPAVSPKNIEIAGKSKMCARCKAHNAHGNKTCTECGFRFGKIVLATDGKSKLGLVTCPGCGSVYQVKKNVPFIVIMVLLAIILLNIGLPSALFLLTPLIVLVLIVLAVMHASGRLQCVSIRKCTVCNKTPLAVFVQHKRKAAEEKRDQKLLNRSNSALIQGISSFNAWMENNISEANLLPIGTIVSTVIFAIMMFISNEVVLSWEGLIEKTQDLMYLDAILNFGGPLQVISLLSLAFLFVATIITNFLPRQRLNGVSMILGFITGIVEIILAVSNSALQEFEYVKYIYGERIVYDGQYSTGIVNIGIIISAIIMIAVVFIAHMIEKEKRYLALTSNQTME